MPCFCFAIDLCIGQIGLRVYNKDDADPDGQQNSQSHKRFLNDSFRRDSSLEDFGALRKMYFMRLSLLFFLPETNTSLSQDQTIGCSYFYR